MSGLNFGAGLGKGRVEALSRVHVQGAEVGDKLRENPLDIFQNFGEVRNLALALEIGPVS